MADTVKKNGSAEEENPGNPLPSSIDSIASFASVFQNPEFVSMMPKATLPTSLDVHLPQHYMASHMVQVMLNEYDLWVNKRYYFPKRYHWVIKWHFKWTKIARIAIYGTNNRPVVSDCNDQPQYDPLDNDDILESSSQCWQSSQELSALKTKQQIVHAFPHPDEDSSFRQVPAGSGAKVQNWEQSPPKNSGPASWCSWFYCHVLWGGIAC